ncbi:MAG TPA: Ig-like domain-containing protein [Longimicrobium sp.]
MPSRPALARALFVAPLLAVISPLSACSLLGDTTGADLAPLRTYERGTMIYLERNDSTGRLRVGLDRRWGGSITEFSLNGENFVNAYDPGREVQLSLYENGPAGDTCAGCTGAWPWNAVQGGDKYGHGSIVLTKQKTDSALYVKSRPLQWFPDDKGGGAARAVPADMVYEMWVSVVPEHPRAIHVRFRATHEASDAHLITTQEVPAVFANGAFANFVYYGGTEPWTGGAVSRTQMRSLNDPAWASSRFYIPERWGAFVNARGVGMTMYAPAAYPYAIGYALAGYGGGTSGFDTNYFTPLSYFAVSPRAVVEADVYLIAGDVESARRVVYDLHQRLPVTDINAPLLQVDAPRERATLSGVVPVSGVAFDDVGVAAVDVLVDGEVVGAATRGGAPAVVPTFFNLPPNSAFEYRLDSTRLANGTHTLSVRATDAAGNASVATVAVTVAN